MLRSPDAEGAIMTFPWSVLAHSVRLLASCCVAMMDGPLLQSMAEVRSERRSPR